MRVITLDSHDGYEEGDVYDVPEHVATKLIEKGLVKAGPVPENKMAPRHEDKRGPTPTVGAGVPFASSPAVQASPMPTVIPLHAGDSANLSRESIRQVMKAEVTEPAPTIDTATNVPPLETSKPKRKSYYKPTGRPRGRPRKGT